MDKGRSIRRQKLSFTLVHLTHTNLQGIWLSFKRRTLFLRSFLLSQVKGHNPDNRTYCTVFVVERHSGIAFSSTHKSSTIAVPKATAVSTASNRRQRLGRKRHRACGKKKFKFLSNLSFSLWTWRAGSCPRHARYCHFFCLCRIAASSQVEKRWLFLPFSISCSFPPISLVCVMPALKKAIYLCMLRYKRPRDLAEPFSKYKLYQGVYKRNNTSLRGRLCSQSSLQWHGMAWLCEAVLRRAPTP